MKQKPEREFYVTLFSNAEARNQLTPTAQKCQYYIDHMEDTIEHNELPECYDWLVAKRNRLQRESSKNASTKT